MAAALVVLLLWIAPDGSIQSDRFDDAASCAAAMSAYAGSWCELRAEAGQ